MKPQVLIAIIGVLSVGLLLFARHQAPHRAVSGSANVDAGSSFNSVIGRDPAFASGPKEPVCIFDPPQSTNATNAPCYTILRAVATDNSGAQTASEPTVVHITKCVGKNCPR